jgi:hypothetical protein
MRYLPWRLTFPAPPAGRSRLGPSCGDKNRLIGHRWHDPGPLERRWIAERLVGLSSAIILGPEANSPGKADKGALAETARIIIPRMRSHANRARGLAIVVAITLAGAATSARAQTEPADSQDAAPLSQEPGRGSEPNTSDRDGMALKADSHHDGLFRAMSAAFVIAAGADVSVSMYQIGRGAAREKGFGAQWQDSPVAFALTKSAMTAAFGYGLQRIYKDRPKAAFVLGLAATAFEGWLVMRSARVSASQP